MLCILLLAMRSCQFVSVRSVSPSGYTHFVFIINSRCRGQLKCDGTGAGLTPLPATGSVFIISLGIHATDRKRKTVSLLKEHDEMKQSSNYKTPRHCCYHIPCPNHRFAAVLFDCCCCCTLPARFWTRIKRARKLRIVEVSLKCDGTRAETRFRLSVKRMSPFKSAGTSFQSTTVSRGVRISGSNAGYTMFRGSVKSTGYPLHSPVSPSLPLHGSPARGPPGCIMRPVAIFANFVYAIKVTEKYKGLRYNTYCYL